jgi:hypothetical protein
MEKETRGMEKIREFDSCMKNTGLRATQAARGDRQSSQYMQRVKKGYINNT